MKCPYCGRESRNEICDYCSARIPAEKPKKEQPKDDTKVYRRNKDKE